MKLFWVLLVINSNGYLESISYYETLKQCYRAAYNTGKVSVCQKEVIIDV